MNDYDEALQRHLTRHDTNANTLRQAAALIRERAKAVTPGPWRYQPDLYPPTTTPNFLGAILSDSPEAEGMSALVMDIGQEVGQGQHAEWIATWHPGVALAVVALLDRATAWEEHNWTQISPDWVLDSLAIARAVLGETEATK